MFSLTIDHSDGGHVEVLPPDEPLRRERQALPAGRRFRHRQIRLHQRPSQPKVGQRQVRVRHALLHQQHHAHQDAGHYHEQAGQAKKRFKELTQ